ncbi:MAG: sodium-dependent transporter, partial [Prevotella sp.]|nr:sodium-dependent transporter [Prevotella sp.]
GQAFFSLSLGVYCICTYGCYFRKDGNLVRESLSVAGIDTLVALLAGLMIFPAVFSVEGLQPAAGPGLVFITLPNVFRHVFSFSPLLSYMFSLLFYFLLVLAALTSMISMLETSASIFIRKYKIPRPVACFGIALVCTALVATCSLSFGAWQDIKPFGLSIFEMFDFAVAKLIMPVCSLVSCLFAGWVVDRKILRDEITNGGALRQPLYPVYHIIIRYVAPVGIALIFINELGWL